jgi:hypothetical protein
MTAENFLGEQRSRLAGSSVVGADLRDLYNGTYSWLYRSSQWQKSWVERHALADVRAAGESPRALPATPRLGRRFPP